MTDSTESEAEDVLNFWLGKLDEQGRADAAHAKSWFTRDAAFDQTLRDRFGNLHASIVAGERELWLDGPRPCLAYVIVLDQFSRNMFRDTPRMFSQDAQALKAATAAVEHGWDKLAAFDERGFFYMPFMHSEDLAAQERSVALFTAFRDELADKLRERIEMALGYAHSHRDIIARFGRFPHRNALLGRSSTPEEIEFLTQPGSSF